MLLGNLLKSTNKKYQKISIDKVNSREEKAWVSLGLAELTLAIGDKNAAIKLIRYVLDNFEDNFDLKQKAEEINGKFNVGSQG